MLQSEGVMNGHPLRVLRTQLDLSQKDFADKIGVSEATISRAENGHRLSPKVRRQLCDRLGKTSEELGLMGRKREVIRPASPPSQAAQNISLQAVSTQPQVQQTTYKHHDSALIIRQPQDTNVHVEQQQEQSWLTLGTSYLGQLFDQGWSTNSILNALKVVLQGVEEMPALIRQNFLEQGIGTVTSKTPFFTNMSISEEERTKLHITLSESIVTSWKLFLSTNCTQMLAIGQALLFLIQRSSQILYPTVLPSITHLCIASSEPLFFFRLVMQRLFRLMNGLISPHYKQMTHGIWQKAWHGKLMYGKHAESIMFQYNS